MESQRGHQLRQRVLGQCTFQQSRLVWPAHPTAQPRRPESQPATKGKEPFSAKNALKNISGPVMLGHFEKRCCI